MIYDYILIFLIGSIVGWFLEIFWRNIFINKKINLNPGFLFGPYIPIYGFGLLTLYLISFLNIHILLKIFLSGLLLVVIELISSLILLHIFNIRLWDYFSFPFNVNGHICLTYFFLWTILASLFHIKLSSLFFYVLDLVKNNLSQTLFIFLFSLLILDLILTIRKYFHKKN